MPHHLDTHLNIWTQLVFSSYVIKTIRDSIRFEIGTVSVVRLDAYMKSIFSNNKY